MRIARAILGDYDGVARVVGDELSWDGGTRVPNAEESGSYGRDIPGIAFPGLVDVHCHIGLEAHGGTTDEVAEQQALTERSVGVLLMRDCGSPIDNRWVQQRKDLPRLLRSGRHIARPKRYLRNFAVELEDPSDFPNEMARQARNSDGWVKIVADWIDRNDGADAVVSPLWPADILKDGIAAAHAEGARVTAHAFSHAAITPLLDAGIDCIEHGTGMDADQIDEAARRGIPITPTMMQVDAFDEFAAAGAEKFPAYAKQMHDMWLRRDEQLWAFVDAGIQLLPGSDAGGTIDHGTLPEELIRWGEAGIPPADVMAFATWKAREYLGVSPTAADLVFYDSDPREDLTILHEPRAVIIRGELFEIR